MKTPFALLMNDLHIDKDCCPDFRLNWNEALSVCRERGIDEIIIGGDLWTSRASQTLQVLLTVRECLAQSEKLGITVTIASGNHCKVDQKSTDSYNTIFSDMKGVEVVKQFAAYYLGNLMFVVCSYFSEDGEFQRVFKEFEDKCLKDIEIEKKDIILYLHEGIHGALGDMDLPNELPQEMFKDYRKVLVGHYHNRIRIKNTNIEYIGSSRQLSFGEDEEKGYTVLYEDGTTEFIKNKVNTRYETITLSYKQLQDGDYQLKKDSRYRYRLRLMCTGAEMQTIDRKALLDSGFHKIVFATERTVASEIKETDMEKKFDKAGIQKEYIDFCGNKGIESQLGLEYLSKIN